MQYLSLRKRISLTRHLVETQYSTNGPDSSLRLSQYLDTLIHYAMLVRKGDFCRHPIRGAVTGRHKIRLLSRRAS